MYKSGYRHNNCCGCCTVCCVMSMHLLIPHYSGETGSGCEAEPGSFFWVLVRTDTDILLYGRIRHRKRTVLPQIAIRNRRFSQISSVSLANLRKSNESITRRSRFGTG
jgi:hypothetical protein